jgi:hypothetical protein
VADCSLVKNDTVEWDDRHDGDEDVGYFICEYSHYMLICCVEY